MVWVLLMGVFSWPAVQMYASTELVVNRLSLVEPAMERMERDFPSLWGRSVLGIELRSEEPMVCLGTNATCGQSDVLQAIEAWAKSDAEVLEYRSYTTYDRTELDDLKEMFVDDDRTVLLCVGLPMTRMGEGSKAIERERRVVGAIQGLLPSGIRMRYTGVNAIKNRVEQDTQRNALVTELVTVPFAMALFAWIFGSSKPVVMLMMQLLTVAVLSFGGIGVWLRFQRVPIMDTTQCVIMELFALAFTTDYTFLMLRRFQQERRRGLGYAEAMETMREQCGHVVKVSGGLITGMVLAMLVPQLENLAFKQFVTGLTVMLSVTMMTTLWGVPFWVQQLGIDFDLAKPRPKQTKTQRCSYASALGWMLESKRRIVGTMVAMLLVLSVPTMVEGPRATVVGGWDHAWTRDVYEDATSIVSSFPILNQGSIVLTGLNLTSDLRGAFEAAANVTETLLSATNLDPDDVWSASGFLGERINASDAARRRSDDALYREIWDGSVGQHNDSLMITMISRTPLQSDAHIEEWGRVNEILATEPLMMSPASLVRYSESEGYLLSLEVMRRYMIPSLWLALLFGMTMLAVVLNSVFLPLRMLVTVMVPLAAVYSMAQGVFGFLHIFGLFITLPLLFGLALDYELFLVLRVKEYRWGGETTTEAVRTASEDTNMTIMLAGLVMMISFSGFCWMDSPLLHQLGFVIEMGVLLDTFVVRPWLVPCMMTLGEGWVWWPSVPPVIGEEISSGEQELPFM